MTIWEKWHKGYRIRVIGSDLSIAIWDYKLCAMRRVHSIDVLNDFSGHILEAIDWINRVES